MCAETDAMADATSFQVIFTGYVITEVNSIRYGTGKHVIFVTNPKSLTIVCSPPSSKFWKDFTEDLKSYIIVESLYCAALLSIKLSILCLYNRIFPQRWFRITSIVVAVFIAALFTTGFFASIFQCVPISSQWNPKVPGRCINYGSWVHATGIVNILSDFILLGLPMPLVWRIKTSKAKRWQLTITFAMGTW